MRLVRLSMEGYRQFRDPVSIDFPDGLTGISGPNGAGKSKIIEAIGYALFGPSRKILPNADRTTDLASRAGGVRVQPRVELVFDLRGHRYRVLRSPNRIGLWIDNDAESQVSAARALNDQIQRLLRLSASTFRGTFVAHQKDVAGFQSADGPTRKSLMHQLIGVAQVDQAIALADAEIEHRRAATSALFTAVRLSPEQAAADHGEAQRAYDELELEAERVIEQHREATRLLDRIAAAVVQVGRRQQVAEGIERQLAELDKHRRSLAETIISARRQLVSFAQDEVARLEATRKFKETQAASASASSLARLKAVADAREQVAALRDRLEGPLASRSAARVTAERRRRELEATAEDLRAQVAELNSRKTKATTAAGRADDSRIRLLQQRASAEQLGEKGACISCGFELGPRLPTFLDHLDSEMQLLIDEKVDQLAQVASIDVDLEQRQRELDRITDELKTINADLSGKHSTVPGEIAATEEALASSVSGLAAAEAQLTNADRIKTYDAAVHADAQAKASEHVEAREALAKFAGLDERRGAVEEQLSRARAELRRENLRARTLRAEWQQTVPSFDEINAARDTERQARQGAETANQAQVRAREQLAAAGERLKAAHTALQDAIEAAQHVQNARRRQSVAEETGRSLRELYAALSAEAIPALEQRLDAWMPTVLGPRFREVKLTQDYGIEANNGSGTHGLSHFSGGEQTVLAIMLRAAVALFCRERAGFDRGFLVLDEVFGDQDQQRRHLLVQFLEEIKIDYHQIVVVNHIEEISGQLDTVIEVELIDDNESRVHVSR